MIEIPRAALTADRVATETEFFSFGGNDLTQTGMGLSRDNCVRFSNDHEGKKIYKNDPFLVLHRDVLVDIPPVNPDSAVIRGVVTAHASASVPT